MFFITTTSAAQVKKFLYEIGPMMQVVSALEDCAKNALRLRALIN